ncbi:MAG: hypothetical protein M3R72_08925 [Bacteroidota bacterium]|nr:hypothetical protein [Bacteroidota bacterium]
MSIEEIKEKKEKVIAAIQGLPENKLASVEAFINEINNDKNEYSIDFIYNKAVDQYHDTLQKLAQ